MPTMLMEWIRRHSDHFEPGDEAVPVHRTADRRPSRGTRRPAPATAPLERDAGHRQHEGEGEPWIS